MSGERTSEAEAELERTLPFAYPSVARWLTSARAQERLSPPWWPLRIVASEEGTLSLRAASHTLGEIAFERRDEVDLTESRFELRLPHDSVVLRTRVFSAGSGSTRWHECSTSAGLAARLPRVVPARVLAFRAERARHDLSLIESLTRAIESLQLNDSLRVAVTGASGLVGRALTSVLLSAGHRVHPLVRRAARPGSDEISWDPARQQLDRSALEGVDALIHFAGENVGAGRWSEARKRRIYESRVAGTELLARALVQLRTPPRVWVGASAIGIYGDRGTEVVDAASPLGSGFLADVCRAWEAAAAPARDAGMRVVQLRLGMVVTAQGGALARMLPPFRVGAGGPIGSGRQIVSWISLDDVLGIVLRALTDDALRGPIDAVAPTAVSQAELAALLGEVLQRPSRLRVPSTAVRALFGQMGEELLLSSTHVRPTQLQSLGFRFEHATLESCLRLELGRLPSS